MPDVRVVTWNVWHRFGDWEARQPRIVDVLRAAAPDVVCLQEVFTTEDTDQAGDLAAALGLDHHVNAHLAAHEGVTFGNAILSRHPIVDHVVHHLPTAGEHDERRTLLVAELDTPKRRLTVGCTHLNFRWDQSHVRQAQVRFVCETLAARRPFQTAPVLGGDLNAAPDSDEVRMLTGRTTSPISHLGFHDAWETAADDRWEPRLGVTWDRGNTNVRGHEPDRRIDYLLVGHPVEYRGAATTCERIGVDAIDGMHASDHYGLVATVQV